MHEDPGFEGPGEDQVVEFFHPRRVVDGRVPRREVPGAADAASRRYV